MQALRVQRTGHGASAGLISRAGAPVGGASSSRAYGAGARPDRADRVGVRCAPFTQAAGLVEPGEAPASAGGFGAGAAALLHAIAAVNASAVAAPGALAMADYTEAAHYAGMAEELSRTVEYLQILSAGAVDRTRTRAINEAATRAARNSRNGRSWVTGWDNGTETLNETDTSWPGNTAPATTPTEPSSPADDGCKNTAEFLRLSLWIGISEARRRLHLAHEHPARHHPHRRHHTPTTGTPRRGTGTHNPRHSHRRRHGHH